MKTTSIIIMTVVVLGIALVLIISLRKPEVRNDVQEMGHDIKQGVHDSYDATKDAVKDAVKDAKDGAKPIVP